MRDGDQLQFGMALHSLGGMLEGKVELLLVGLAHVDFYVVEALLQEGRSLLVGDAPHLGQLADLIDDGGLHVRLVGGLVDWLAIVQFQIVVV